MPTTSSSLLTQIWKPYNISDILNENVVEILGDGKSVEKAIFRLILLKKGCVTLCKIFDKGG